MQLHQALAMLLRLRLGWQVQVSSWQPDSPIFATTNRNHRKRRNKHSC